MIDHALHEAAPGENEDLQGKAFVGRAGQLLDKIMASIGLDTNQDMLIVNVVKCRPPDNRAPTQAEADNCKPYLDWQIKQVKPQIIVLLGATAAKHLMPKQKGQNMKDRVGKFFEIREYPGIRFLLLYHPAYLLRDPRKKVDMGEHIKQLTTVLAELNRESRGAKILLS
jgi:DNA polymerase